MLGTKTSILKRRWNQQYNIHPNGTYSTISSSLIDYQTVSLMLADADWNENVPGASHDTTEVCDHTLQYRLDSAALLYT